MKKIYFVLALLLALVGYSAHALLITIDEDAEPKTVTTLHDGDNVVIRMAISNYNGGVGNHTLTGKSTLADTGEEVATHPGVDIDKVGEAHVWVLEKANTDANGTWWYLKNVKTGRYVTYHADTNFNPNAPETLPAEDDPNFETGFFNEDNWVNCYIPFELTENKAEALPVLFMKPSEGVLLLGDYPTNENVVDLINTVDDNHMMLMVKFNVGGTTIWATLNSAYSNPGVSRYNDWAGYWQVLPPTVSDDAFDEFNAFINSLTIQAYPIGNDPGCVNETEAAEQYNEAIAKYRAEIDNDHDQEYWAAALAELRALIESLPNFTFKGVSEGIYRIASAKNNNWLFINNNGDGGCQSVAVENTTLNHYWQVYKNEAGDWCMKNLGTMRYIIPVAPGTNSVALKGDYEEHPITFECTNKLTVGDQTFTKAAFNIWAGQYLHTQGTNLLVWYDKASVGDMWLFESVSTEDLQTQFGEDIMSKLELNSRYYKLLNDAQAAIARAKNSGDENLITSASQISSPKTQAGEGSIANLIDGDYGTYWHSEWSGGDVSADNSQHYLQYDLGRAIKEVTMKYVRRPSQNDHPTQFKIFASTSADGEFVEITEFPVAEQEVEVRDTDENGDYIILSETPRLDENGEQVLDADGNPVMDITYQTHTEIRPSAGANNTMYTYNLDLGAEYQYVRVLATMTDYWRGYWHASELYFVIQAYDLWTPVKTEGEALEAAIAAAKAAAASETGITADVVDALQAAYDAFLAAFPDPTILNNLIAEAKTELATYSAGNDPGQKPQATWDALDTAVKAAEAWLKANMATANKEALAAQEKAMRDAIAAWKAVAINPVEVGKWYYIQMPNARSGHTATAYYPAGVSFQDARLAAMYGESGTVSQMGVDATIGVVTKDMYEGNHTYGENNTTYYVDDDMLQWRLVEYKGWYAIQNKATGNFMRPVIASNEQFTLSPVPGLFFINEIGGGKYGIGTKYGEDKNGVDQLTYINIYGQGYAGAYFAEPSTDTGSQWVFRTVGEVTEEPKIIFALDGYTAKGYVLPYTIDASTPETQSLYDGFYTSVLNIDTEKGEVHLEAATGNIEAGTPFIAYTPEQELAHFTVPADLSNMTTNVSSESNIMGTLALGVKAPVGVLKPLAAYDEANNAVVSILTAETNARPGDAWIDYKGDESLLNNGEQGDEVLTFVPGGELQDAINSVFNQQQGTVYNLNGQRVATPANGLYIINGRKVVVR